MSVLTERVILHRSKANSLSNVKKLQCWGMNLEDVSVLESACNLEVLNLSCNNLKTLSHLKNCHNIQQLYLRKNNITDVNELSHLKDLTNLKVLWLAGNPITSIPNYRTVVLELLPQVHTLDQTVVTEQERELASIVRSRHNEEQSRLCSAVTSLLHLLDQNSLNTVNETLQSLITRQ